MAQGTVRGNPIVTSRDLLTGRGTGYSPAPMTHLDPARHYALTVAAVLFWASGCHRDLVSDYRFGCATDEDCILGYACDLVKRECVRKGSASPGNAKDVVTPPKDLVLIDIADVANVTDVPPVTTDLGGCKPQCAGRKCGPNGCGGVCGVCAPALPCDAAGQCKSAPPGMVLIPAGSFMMGSPQLPVPEGFDSEWPQHKVLMSAFYLDAAEVTWAEWKTHQEALGHPVTIPSDCQDTAYGTATNSCANHPVIGLTWEEARGACQWSGRRLPSEAEWEYAARSAKAYRFPWGDDCPSEFNDAAALTTCSGDAWTEITAKANCTEVDCHDGFGRTAPVRSFPLGKSAQGVYDLIGNAIEWVADPWHSNYEGAPTTGIVWNGSSADYVFRGGAANNVGWVSRAANRYRTVANYADWLGVRCAWP